MEKNKIKKRIMQLIKIKIDSNKIINVINYNN